MLQHLEEQNKNINDATQTYLLNMEQREKNAKMFVTDKTVTELKDYLATQPVAYNDWKDADIEKLKKLVYDVYDE